MSAQIRLSENAPARAGEAIYFDEFLRTFGAAPEKWPLEHCLCTGCGEQAVPKFFSPETRRPDSPPGYFDHGGDSARTIHCPTQLYSRSLSYIPGMETDYRVRDRVESILNNPLTRRINDGTLGKLLGRGGMTAPMDCFAQPHARTLLSLPYLLGRPRAFPLLLAALAGPVRKEIPGIGKVWTRYRLDHTHNNGDYVNFDGEVVRGPAPKHLALHFRNSGQQIAALRPIDFPELDTRRIPAPHRAPIPAQSRPDAPAPRM